MILSTLNSTLYDVLPLSHMHHALLHKVAHLLLTGTQGCQSPAIAQGYLVPEQESYEHGSEVSYACDSGLKSTSNTWWGVRLNVKTVNGPTCLCVLVSFIPL